MPFADYVARVADDEDTVTALTSQLDDQAYVPKVRAGDRTLAGTPSGHRISGRTLAYIIVGHVCHPMKVLEAHYGGH